MNNPDARSRSLALIHAALSRTKPTRPLRPRRGPDAIGDGITADPPRRPTLSGGAAATLDA